MHDYDHDLAALTMGQTEGGGLGQAACEAAGRVWSENFGCLGGDLGPGDDFFPTGNGGGGAEKTTNGAGISTNEILGIVAIATIAGAAVYFWRR